MKLTGIAPQQRLPINRHSLSAPLSLDHLPPLSMDSGQQLGRRFEEHLMKRRICDLTDIEDVKKVAVGLVELNFQLKDQLRQWAKGQSSIV